MCINIVMPITEIMFKDKDGFHYKHPGDFASYGCKMFEDINTFDVWKPKK